MTDHELAEKLARQVRLLQGEARQLRKHISELERELEKAKRRAE